MELSALPTRELFRFYRRILRELTDRGVIRTMNAPAGDYAEHLVAALTHGELADNSEKSWDVQTDSERLQVKCRVIDPAKSKGRQLSPFRTWEFDRAVIVLFDEDYDIYRCAALPMAVLKEHSSYREHVNGYVVRATEALLAHPEAEDLTDALRTVSSAG